MSVIVNIVRRPYFDIDFKGNRQVTVEILLLSVYIPPVVEGIKQLIKAKDGDMLVLTRRINEKIRIGDYVPINIAAIQNNAVQIGIEAPESVDIARDEIDSREDKKGRNE